MALRDRIVAHMAERMTGTDLDHRLGNEGVFAVLPASLEARGLTLDDWWAAVQRADDLYVRIGEALDWDAISATLHAELRAQGRESWSSMVVRERFQALVQQATLALGLPEFAAFEDLDSAMEYGDRQRMLYQAESHYARRHGRDAPDDVDGAALREAFLSTDCYEMYDTADRARRQRNMRAEFGPKVQSSLAFFEQYGGPSDDEDEEEQP